jgi:hypothetical protein
MSAKYEKIKNHRGSPSPDNARATCSHNVQCQAARLTYIRAYTNSVYIKMSKYPKIFDKLEPLVTISTF